MTVRRPLPESAGTGRTSQRGASSAYRRLRVSLSSRPLWATSSRDWKRITAERVHAPLSPSAGPAWHPRWLSRFCALVTQSAASAGAATVRTSVMAATRARRRLTPPSMPDGSVLALDHEVRAADRAGQLRLLTGEL